MAEEKQASKTMETNLDMFQGLGDLESLGFSETEIQELEKTGDPEKPVESTQGQPDGQQTTDPEKPGAQTETDPETPGDEPKTGEAPEGETTPDPSEIDNPFVSKKQKEEKEIDLKDLKIDNIEPLQALFKETGIELKDAKDLKLVADKFIENQSQLTEVQGENQNLKDYKLVFESLPADIFDVVHAYLNDKDYRQAMRSYASSYVDFTQPFDKQELQNVMNHYYPGKFSAEDFEDVDNDPKMKQLITVTQERFNNDASRIEKQKTEYTNSLNERKQLYEQQYKVAIDNLKKQDFANDRVVKDVSNILKGGLGAIVGLFTDEKGNLSADAGEKLSYLLYSKDAINYYANLASKKASKKAVSEHVEKTVSRSSGGTRTKKGENENPDVAKAQEVINQMIPKQPKSNF